MPTIGTFRRSASASGNTSKSIEEFKRAVALVVGAQDRPDEVGALDAIHGAIDKINETKWEFLLSYSTITTTAGESDYALPVGTRSVQSLRVGSSNQRKLTPIRIDIYDRMVADQTSLGLPMFYAVHRYGQGRLLTLLPVPEMVETLIARVYTDLAKPSNETTVVILPSFMERPLILQAQVLVSQWRGLRSERVATLMALAEDALRGAQMRDRDWHDEDVGITMDPAPISYWPWNHPNRSE